MARQPAPQGERRYLWFGVLAGFLLAVLVHQYASLFYFASSGDGLALHNLETRQIAAKVTVTSGRKNTGSLRTNPVKISHDGQGDTKDLAASRVDTQDTDRYQDKDLPKILKVEEVEGDGEGTEISQLLEQLDSVVRSKASEKQIYGHIYNHANLEQPLSYLKALREYSGPAERICEIGFAGGHSATIFLHALPNAEYQAFDQWDRPFYEDAALAQVKAMFPTRQISVTKGDSTKTVPKYQGMCDVIHVDGAHHAHYPATDLANMEKLANPAGHLLFVDDCATSFPAVLNAWSKMKAEGRVEEHTAEVPEGWSFRGKQKGWCIGEYSFSSPVSD